jgi:GNAT superfamily N-acetyltransferase
VTATLIIRHARRTDAGEILVVQRAAYLLEAQLYGDPMIEPLVETLEEVRDAVERSIVLVALRGARIVGAVRGRIDGRLCRVGTLAVAPDVQGEGIGTALMDAIEEEVRDRVDGLAVFTGDRSAVNLRLYRRHGYRETHRHQVAPHLTFIHLRKLVGVTPLSSG